ncbi:MAG: hypothetical protein U1F43_37775 [Myxococcota bacterium]
MPVRVRPLAVSALASLVISPLAACDSAADDTGDTTVGDTRADTADTAAPIAFSSYSVGPSTAAFIDACDGGTTLSLDNNDENLTPAGAVTVPFDVVLYDRSFTGARVSTNGWLSFSDYLTDSAPRHESGVQPLPSDGAPNAAIYALWEDLEVKDADSGLCVKTVGTAPARTFVVEWHNVSFAVATPPTGDLTFEIQLQESDHAIDLVYRSLDAGADLASRFSHVTVGVENEHDLTSSHPGDKATSVSQAPSTSAGFRFTPVE